MPSLSSERSAHTSFAALHRLRTLQVAIHRLSCGPSTNRLKVQQVLPTASCFFLDLNGLCTQLALADPLVLLHSLAMIGTIVLS